MSSFLKADQDRICENLNVEFDQKATPKGYTAIKIKILGDIELGYVAPDEFICSKSSSIKGYEILDNPGWAVHGSSSSLDVAKLEMITHARQIGANSLMEVKYTKTTDNEGNYYYGVHNFMGRAVNLGKKLPNGEPK